MNTKANSERVIAVVCPHCGYADQQFESQLINDVLCPDCGHEMTTDVLIPSTTTKRQLKVVKSNSSKKSNKKAQKGNRTMKKASKTTKKEDTTKDQVIEEVVETPQDNEPIDLTEFDSNPAEETPQEDEPIHFEEVDLNDEAEAAIPPADEIKIDLEEEPTEVKTRAKRKPIMTKAQIWGIYAAVIACTNPESIFDTFAKTFEEKWMLSYWLHRTGLKELATFNRGRDIVQFFRKVAHEVARKIKNQELTADAIPEIAAEDTMTVKLNEDVLKANNPDEIFDCFGRTLESKRELSVWLYKTGRRKLIQLGKHGDMVEYFRRVSHKLWSELHKKA